ncbi:gas vesicle protein [Streptomyces ruber]|uniref:Gas vesicle protein n=2 Tax=Streptomyces TaxID=1883 RepID=A0A918EP47_9ACTN|nr:gas vesicle protein [Streptomyces ruber]GGQ47588.1 gas vesicle protein [Streptomyces ruber]
MTNTSQSSKPRKSHTSSADDEEQQEIQENPDNTENPDSTESEERAAKPRRPRPMEVLRNARTQLAELTGLVPESVSTFEQSEDGWTLEVEVLELERVPDTMSLMASYLVELDQDGELTGYRRVRRYERGRADPRRSGGQ